MKINDIVILLEESLKNGLTFTFPINGTSMRPLLKTGDFVELTKPLDLKKYDIILYKRLDGSYVLHRIVGVKDYFILLGDHQTNKEFPIYKNQVIAKAISYTKNNKKKYFKGFIYKMYLFTLKFKPIRWFYGRFL